MSFFVFRLALKAGLCANGVGNGARAVALYAVLSAALYGALSFAHWLVLSAALLLCGALLPAKLWP